MGDNPSFPAVATAAGELLAGSQLTNAELSTTLRSLALRDVAGNVPRTRGLIQDAIRISELEIIALAPISETERMWWSSIAVWTAGDTAGALMALLGLPHSVYRQRLAYFMAAPSAVLSTLPPEAMQKVMGSFTGGPPAIAARLALAKFDSTDTNRSELIAFAAGNSNLQTACGSLGSLLTGAAGEGAKSRLLGARFHGASRLGTDAKVLDGVRTEIFDDLIDLDRVPHDWPVPGDYFRARLDIGALDEVQLKSLHADTELARRHLVAHGCLPEDISSSMIESIGPFVDCLSGDLSAAVEVTAGSTVSPEHLSEAMGDRSTFPQDSVLADDSCAELLLSRAEDLRLPALEGMGPPQRRFAAAVCLRDARSALQEWRWSDSLTAARECLRFSSIEQQRDEALNLLAYCMWQLENDSAAIDALSTALEDDYSDALLSNMAVVAAEVEPELAAEHLSRLVVEAPNLDFRIAAARRAVNIWGRSDEPWAEDENLPTSLATALRDLIVEPIEEADFVEFARLLSNRDQAWMARPGSLAGSPHANSDAARVWQARAADLESFIKELSNVMKKSSPSWAGQERDWLVTAAIDAVVTENPPVGAIGLGMLILDENLPMEPDDRSVLRAFVARGAALSIDPEDGEPAEKFLNWLEAASRELKQMPPELQDRASSAVSLGFSSLAAAYYQARFNQLAQAAEFHDRVLGQIRYTPRRRINRSAIRQAAQPALSLLSDTKQLVNRLLPHVEAELAEALKELRAHCIELESAFHQLAR